MASTPKPSTRYAFLNRLVSRSISRGPEEHKPPIHSIVEALEVLEQRLSSRYQSNTWAYLKIKSTSMTTPRGFRLPNLSIPYDWHNSSELLVVPTSTPLSFWKHVDQAARSFPVVDVGTFKGRKISGERNERGSCSCHVVVRLPVSGEYDDGSYRCVIEHVPPFTRKMIERFLCNQLRRHAVQQEYSFTVLTTDKKNRNVEKQYKYYPQLQLLSDIGRPLAGGGLLRRSSPVWPLLRGMSAPVRQYKPS